MNHQNDHDLRDLLKKSVPQVSEPDLRRELWPQMRERLNRQPALAAVHVPWFDLTLAALAAVALLLFPGVIPALFYHL